MPIVEPELPPGFRFHPTDEELILHYLRNRAASLPCPVHIITELDIYRFNPWDLPDMAVFGDKEWYFFTPRDRKYPNGVRPNRAAGSGYWKATGTDRPIATSSGGRTTSIGVKKALVFYVGKPPKGTKTGWIMHEYRLAGALGARRPLRHSNSSMRLDDWVLCRIYRKNSYSPTDQRAEEPLIEDSPSPITVDLPQQKTAAPQDPHYSMLASLLRDDPVNVVGDADLFSMMAMGQNSFEQSLLVGEAFRSPAFKMDGGLESQRVSDEERWGELHPFENAARGNAVDRAPLQVLMGNQLGFKERVSDWWRIPEDRSNGIDTQN